MKNILEISNQLGIGGTEKTMQIFCRYLDKSKYNVFACGMFEGGARYNLILKYVEDIIIANGDIQKIKDFVIQKNIDIVHFHSISGNSGERQNKIIDLLNFLKSRNIKTIETAPFSLFDEYVDDIVDAKIFVSRTNLIKYLRKFENKIKDKSKYCFLYNPLDVEELNKYRLDDKEKINLRKKYNISQDDFVIGKVGRASLWKWDDAIIDVIPYIIKEIPNLKIVIRAIPEYKKQKIKNKGIEKYFVYLPESVNEQEICETYQLMDIMIHTSRIGESGGIAIYEGLFFGLPIITKSTDFTKFTLFDRDNAQLELVKNNQNGFVENNVKKMSQKIINLYKNKELIQNIGQNNHQKALEVLDAKIITKKLEDIFEGNSKIDFETNIDDYKKTVEKEGSWGLIQENIKAIYEKLMFKC